MAVVEVSWRRYVGKAEVMVGDGAEGPAELMSTECADNEDGH